MQHEGSDYARHKEGDVAILRDDCFNNMFWNSSFNKLAGNPVTITHEYNDLRGYYYGIKEAPYAVDISLLKPMKKFEINDDDDLTDIECQMFAEGFTVEA